MILDKYEQSTICKSRNGESGNGMKGRMGTRGIKVGMQGIRVGMRGMGLGMLGMRGMREIMVGMRGIRVGIRGISVIICENLLFYCFG